MPAVGFRPQWCPELSITCLSTLAPIKGTCCVKIYGRLKKLVSKRDSRGWVKWRMFNIVCPCDLEYATPGEKWPVVAVPLDLCSPFGVVVVSLDGGRVEKNPVALIISNVHALIGENSREADIIIYTDGSIIRSLRGT